MEKKYNFDDHDFYDDISSCEFFEEEYYDRFKLK
jgi:hypothetical protein